MNEYEWKEISRKTGYSVSCCEKAERNAFEFLQKG